MITLITGGPGCGKTALTVSLMMKALKPSRQLDGSVVPPRELFVHGIRDLKLQYSPVACGDESCEFCVDVLGAPLIADFKQWAPPNALIVLDEVQRQYRNRPAGSVPPQFVVDLETHRHGGIDFIMISQSPSFIDQNIRKLCRMHHHLKPAPIGSLKYTWFECNNSPDKLGIGQSERFSPPKETFDVYKSAELHTKQRKPIPKPLVLLVVAVLAAVGFGYKAYALLRQRIEPVTDLAVQSSEFIGGSSSEPVLYTEPTGFARPGIQPDIFDKKPVVDGVLESAPAYAGLVRVQDFPRIVGCLAARDRCKCYTQQATVYATTESFCRAYAAAEANSFDPYQPPSSRVTSGSAAVARVE